MKLFVNFNKKIINKWSADVLSDIKNQAWELKNLNKPENGTVIIELFKSPKYFLEEAYKLIKLQKNNSKSDVDQVLIEAIRSYASQFKQEWVSCADMLPEDTGNYIVVREGVVGNCYFLESLSGESSFIEQSVTHWQPLPTPPTK